MPGARFAGFLLDSEQKTWGRQHAFKAVLNADLETPFGVAGLVRTEQPAEILLRHGTAVGSARERRQDLRRARLLRGAVLRTTDEHAAAARCVAGDRRWRTDRRSAPCRQPGGRDTARSWRARSRVAEAGVSPWVRSIAGRTRSTRLASLLSPGCVLRDRHQPSACTLPIRDRPDSVR